MPPKGTVLNKDDPNLLAFLAYIIDKKVSVSEPFHKFMSLQLNDW